MITNFNSFNLILEKSVLTKLGIPHNVMVLIQKAFQFKNEEPQKISKTKKAIKENLSSWKLILIIHDNNECTVIHHTSAIFEVTVSKFYTDGTNYSHSEPINKMLKNLSLEGVTNIYTFENFQRYRKPETIDITKYKNINDNKILEFKEYFIDNISLILNRLYGKKWQELVDAIQTYYSQITKDIDIFLKRKGSIPGYGYDASDNKISDFKNIGYVLQDFAEKIYNNKTFKLESSYGEVLKEHTLKDIANFLKKRKDLDFSDILLSQDHLVLIKAIDTYGVMKLSTLYARHLMHNMSDWIREKINKYSGLDDEIKKYNL